MCSCKKDIPAMQQTIETATATIGELQSTIQERSGVVEQLKTEVEALGKDLEENKASLAEAQTVRKKEAQDFKNESITSKTNIAAMDQALPALRKGLAGEFLQVAKAPLMTLVRNGAFVNDSDRDSVLSLIQGRTTVRRNELFSAQYIKCQRAK